MSANFSETVQSKAHKKKTKKKQIRKYLCKYYRSASRSRLFPLAACEPRASVHISMRQKDYQRKEFTFCQLKHHQAKD